MRRPGKEAAGEGALGPAHLRCEPRAPPLPLLTCRRSTAAAPRPLGPSASYGDLLSAALAACRRLEGGAGPPPPTPPAPGAAGPRVALFAEPGGDYVAGQWAAWLHRGVTVPLCLSHPDRELSYVLEDAEVAAVLASERHADRLARLAEPLGAAVHVLDAAAHAAQAAAPGGDDSARQAAAAAEVEARLAGVDPGAGALIIYTSGTTGRPKGAGGAGAAPAAARRR